LDKGDNFLPDGIDENQLEVRGIDRAADGNSHVPTLVAIEAVERLDAMKASKGKASIAICETQIPITVKE